MMTARFAISRRGFMFGASAVAGGLVFGSTTVAAQTGQAATAAATEITAWTVIQPDDTTIIRVARTDMGQGIFTALPMLVAEELECDWSKVHAEYADVNRNVTTGKPFGNMVTSTSISVRDSHEYLRRAGAQARAMLVAEAAARWQVPPEECITKNSVTTHTDSNRSLRFGELAVAAAQRPVPENVTLKTPDQWTLIGTKVRRHDSRPKVFGGAIFATDVNLPDMLHAAVVSCPAYGGTLRSFDAAEVLNMPGVTHAVPVGENAVAVVARSWWQAKKGLDALAVDWDETASADLSTASIREMFLEGLDAEDAARGHSIGDVDAALKSAAKTIEVDYEVPHLAHATMEPQTCTAHVTADRADVWAPTQNGEGTTAAVAATLGLDPSQVFVHKLHLGGGFGRRGLAQDWARMSVLIARQVGKPVKMIWSREEDMAHDYYRPMVLARHTAGFDANGRLVGWKVRLAGSSIAASLSPRWLRDGVDYALMDGFSDEDFPYGVPTFGVACARRDTAVPVGFWRGVNLSQNGFFREAFVDEIAEAGGLEPYQLRRQLLAGNPRALAVLDEAATRANWGGPAGGLHQGIAIVEGDHSWCAQVIEVSVTDGRLKVHRVVCVVDPNFIVNPDIVVAQMEGGIVQGLSAALTGQITVEAGRVQQRNFHDYAFLRMNEMPKIEVHLSPSMGKYGEQWGGVGETGLPPTAPALVNAVFAATGKRVRTLPLMHHNLGHRPEMKTQDLTFYICVLAVLTIGLAAVTFVTTSGYSQSATQPADRARSLAYFSRIATVIEHPRCMNCHTSTEFPRQGDDGHPHIMQVKRGPSDTGTAALQCATCHQKTNSPSGVPGNDVWHLAPLRMAWEGLSIGEICRSLSDPQKGGMTHEQLIEHMATDHLVAWAWDPGVDLSGKLRTLPPVSHADFGQLVKDWVSSGAACPS